MKHKSIFIVIILFVMTQLFSYIEFTKIPKVRNETWDQILPGNVFRNPDDFPFHDDLADSVKITIPNNINFNDTPNYQYRYVLGYGNFEDPYNYFIGQELAYNEDCTDDNGDVLSEISFTANYDNRSWSYIYLIKIDSNSNEILNINTRPSGVEYFKYGNPETFYDGAILDVNFEPGEFRINQPEYATITVGNIGDLYLETLTYSELSNTFLGMPSGDERGKSKIDEQIYTEKELKKGKLEDRTYVDVEGNRARIDFLHPGDTSTFTFTTPLVCRNPEYNESIVELSVSPHFYNANGYPGSIPTYGEAKENNKVYFKIIWGEDGGYIDPKLGLVVDSVTVS